MRSPLVEASRHGKRVTKVEMGIISPISLAQSRIDPVRSPQDKLVAEFARIKFTRQGKGQWQE